MVHPLKAGPAGELVATERYRVAGGRSGTDGIEPLATSFAACPVRADAAAGAAVPSASAEPVSVVDLDDRSDNRHPDRSAAPLVRSRPLPVSTSADGSWSASSGRTPPNLVQHAEADQKRPEAVQRLQRGHPASGAAFAAAISSLRELGRPYYLAHGLLDHARYLMRRDDAEAAAIAIQEARDIGQRLRCPPLLDRADAIEQAKPWVQA